MLDWLRDQRRTVITITINTVSRQMFSSLTLVDLNIDERLLFSFADRELTRAKSIRIAFHIF